MDARALARTSSGMGVHGLELPNMSRVLPNAVLGLATLLIKTYIIITLNAVRIFGNGTVIALLISEGEQ
jgi:hypothetical protein